MMEIEGGILQEQSPEAMEEVWDQCTSGRILSTEIRTVYLMGCA